MPGQEGLGDPQGEGEETDPPPFLDIPCQVDVQRDPDKKTPLTGGGCILYSFVYEARLTSPGPPIQHPKGYLCYRPPFWTVTFGLLRPPPGCLGQAIAAFLMYREFIKGIHVTIPSLTLRLFPEPDPFVQMQTLATLTPRISPGVLRVSSHFSLWLPARIRNIWSLHPKSISTSTTESST